ncbi:MAG: helix-turn-helix domain-containing protein [Patescibacteria group bacterium]
MVFVKRKLDSVPETLGEKLRALRRTQAVSLPMLEQMTRIQKRYLEALEHARYDELPEPLYTRNFLKAYARALGADEDYFLELYEEEVGRTDLLGPHRLPRMRVRKGRFFVLSRVTTGISVALPALAIVIYLLAQTSALLKSPEIIVESPVDQSAVRTAILSVEGYVTTNDVTVTVNDETVIVGEDLRFTTEVDLSRGLNIITVAAKRRYSRSNVIYRRVIFDSNLSSFLQGITFVSFQKK